MISIPVIRLIPTNKPKVPPEKHTFKIGRFRFENAERLKLNIKM